MPLTRRGFLGQAAPWALVPLLARCADEDTTDVAASPFLHGVASGDPTSEGVLLWTRLTADPEEDPIVVDWVIALDEALEQVVAEGSASTDAALDHTLSVEPSGLAPDTTYHYQFRALGHGSPVGRTKTLPTGGVSRLKVAVVSCSNYAAGYFHVYRLVAERSDLDFVLHLGDYIYEYGEGEYGTGAPLGRVPDPQHESVSLDDYRRRHAQHKLDPDLQELHRLHPMIAVWDDHEVANDAYRDGAQNHQPDSEGSYADRKAAALQAYFEWMPTRRHGSEQPPRIFRRVPIGDLADLILLDTRHYARDRQPADACDPALLAASGRALLGNEQAEWLSGELARSQARGATWRLIGQQVMLGQLLDPRLGPGCVANTDQWDGYAAERARLLATLRRAELDNVVVLTGDIHSSWAVDITPTPFDPSSYDPATGAGSLAVELVTPAVTSPGPVPPDQAPLLEGVLAQTHPHIKYADLVHQGYLVLDLDHERLEAQWYHVTDVRAPMPAEQLSARVEALAGDNHLTRM